MSTYFSKISANGKNNGHPLYHKVSSHCLYNTFISRHHFCGRPRSKSVWSGTIRARKGRDYIWIERCLHLAWALAAASGQPAEAGGSEIWPVELLDEAPRFPEVEDAAREAMRSLGSATEVKSLTWINALRRLITWKSWVSVPELKLLARLLHPAWEP